MLPLQRLTHPEDPRSYATHLAEGFVMGGVPAVVTSIKDPLKRGRVKCKCDLIDPVHDLPNGEDGFIEVLSSFTCNSSPGGAIAPVTEGSLAFLIPVLGRPDKWICMGFLHNKVDPPSPEHDRSLGMYGFQTHDGTIESHDVPNSAKIRFVAATGIARTESKEGSIVEQTIGGARNTLAFDGNIISETPLSSISQTPKGEISQKNAAGAVHQLHENGEVLLQNAKKASLKLQNGEANLTGPVNAIASNLSSLKSGIFSKLGVTNRLLDQLDDVAKNIPGNPISQVLSEATEILDQVQGTLGTGFDQGLAALNELGSLKTSDLAEAITPQLDQILGSNVGDLATTVENVVRGGFNNPEELVTNLKGVLPENIHGLLEEAAPLIKGLQYNPDILIKGLLDKVIPGGLGEVENLVEMGLHKAIAPMQSIINETHEVLDAFNSLQGSPLSAIDLKGLPTALKNFTRSATTNPRTLEPQYLLQGFNVDSFVESQVLKVQEQIPSNLPITPEAIKTSLLNKDIPSLVAGVQSSFISDAAATFTQAQPLVQGIPQIQSLLNDLKAGSVLGEAIASSPLDIAKDSSIKDTINQAIQPLAEKLKPLLKQGFHQSQKVASSTPSRGGGGMLKLTDQAAKMTASSNGIGAAVEVQKAVSQLLAPGGVSKVFAGAMGVGATSPWGGFGFDALGGGFLSQLPMAMKILQEGQKVAGMFLHPKEGISLANKDEEGKSISHISALDDRVEIGATGLERGIEVSPDGVYLEGVRVTDYLYRFWDDFVTFRTRVGEDKVVQEGAIASLNASVTQLGNDNVAQQAAITSLSTSVARLQSLVWYRCTRNALYLPETDVSLRQAYYFRVGTQAEALAQMTILFPDEVGSGFTVDRVQF
jgi:hypothetical protein